MMSRRTERRRDFESPLAGGHAWITSSDRLVGSATSLLILSLEDRHGGVMKTNTNHYSPHALAAISMLHSAFDAWVTEQIAIPPVYPRTLADKQLLERYQNLCRLVASQEDWQQIWDKLDLVIAVRNEIEHFLPRKVLAADGLPAWLAPLARENVLAASMWPPTLPDGTRLQHSLGEQLKTYALAYWAFDVVEEAVLALQPHLVNALPLEISAAVNFTHFHSVCLPARLTEHDAACRGALRAAMRLLESGAYL